MPFGYDATAYQDMRNLADMKQNTAMNKMEAQNYAYAQMQIPDWAKSMYAGNSTSSHISSGGSSYSGGSSGGSMPSSGGVPTGGGMPSTGYGGGAMPNAAGGGLDAMSSSVQQQYDPWAAHRTDAGTQLAGEMGGQNDPTKFYQNKLQAMSSGQFSPDDPSYQWRFQQGQQAVERSLAAKGLLNSGNAAIELQQYGQGAASQEYGAQFDRMLHGLAGVSDSYGNSMNRLMKMAGVDLDPTAGGKLALEKGKLGLAGQELANQWSVDQSKLGLSAQELANNWSTKNRELDIQAKNSQYSNPAWSSLFAQSSGSPQVTPSWDEIRAAKDATSTAKQSYLDKYSSLWS